MPTLPEDTINPLTGKPVGQKASLKNTAVIGQEDINPLTGLTVGKKGSFTYNPSVGDFAVPATAAHDFNFKATDDLYQFTKYGADVNILTDYTKHRAIMQPGWEQTLAFLNQAIIGEIGGGMIESVGYLLDAVMMGDLAKGQEQEFGNMMSRTGKHIKEWTKEVTPAYEVAPGTFNPGDSGWWASNGPSVFSTLSLMIPAMGFTKAAGMAARGLGLARAAKKGTGVYQKAVGLKPLTVAQEAKIGWVGGAVSQAVMSRHAESLMESSQIFDQNYKKYRQEGLGDKEARELAGKGASKVYKDNWWMLLTDLPQYLMLGAKFTPGGGKVAKAVNDAANKKIVSVPYTGMNTGARFTLGMASEGFEEGYQHVIGEEGTYLSDLQGGFTEESAFADRYDQYIRDGRLWTSVFYGAFGGGIFQAAMPKVQDFINKKQGIPTQDEIIDQKIKIINEMMPALSAATKRVKEADASGIVGMMYQARTNLNLYKALQHIATGTFDQHLAFLDHLENMSEEEVAEWNEANPDVQFDKAVLDELMPELREASHEINNIYQEESKRQKPELAIRTTEELYKISKFKKDAAKYELAVSELEEQYLQKEKLSPVGQELYDVKLQKAAYLQAKKQIEYLLKNDSVAPDARDIYNERMDNFAAAVMILEKQEKELESKERTAAEKKEDARVFDTMKNLDPLNEKKAQLDMLNLAIDTANQRLKRLRDPRTSATGDQRVAERAWTTTQVEEKLKAHSPNSLQKARLGKRVGEGNEVTMKIAGKTISGIVTYPVKKKDIEAARIHLGLGIEKETAEKMKPAPLGYIFISHDNKIIRIIHGDNIDSLNILDREAQAAEANRQEQAEIMAKRRESLIRVHNALKTDIEGLQNKINENKEKIEFSLLELEELASDLQAIDKTTPGYKKKERDYYRKKYGKTPQQWKKEYREKDIREKRDVLQSELNTLLNYYKEINLEGAQNAETAIRKANLHSPYSPLALTEIEKLLETADYHVAETEKEIQRLSAQLEGINKLYDPVKAAELVMTRKTYTKWFEEKYPNNPGSRGYMEQILKSSEPPWSIYKKYIEEHPEYIEDLEKLEKIKARVKDHNEIKNNMITTRRALVMARRTLRRQTQEANMLRGSRNSWMHSQDILSLYKKVGQEYLNLLKEDKQAAIDAETLTANQRASGNLQPPPINPTLKNLEPFLTEAEFAKESLSTTAGFHIDRNTGGVNTKRQFQVRWYAALAKMPTITDEEGYHLQLLTLKYAKENGLEEAYDEEDERTDSATALKAILVDEAGNPVRATDEGELDPKGNILTTYIHKPDFVYDLSKKRIARKYMYEVMGADESETRSLIKNDEARIGKDTYTFDEIVENARSYYSKKHETFRENALAEIEKGNPVFVPILEKSAGIERNLPEVDGKRQRNNLDTFAKLDEIVSFHVPTSNMMALTSNSHVQREVYPGMVYVENERGNTTGALNRLLNEQEVDMIVNMMSYAALNGNEVHRELTAAEKKKKGKKALKTTYYLFPKKGVSSNDIILPNLIYYGKINEEGIRKSLSKEGATEAQIKNEIARRQKHQLYINYQTKTVSYGYEEKSQIPNSVGFTNIKTDPQFREWLLGKYHQINRLNLTSSEKGKTNIYLHPIKFNEDTGGVKMQFYNHSKNMAGYETFLHSLLKTDIVPASEVQFASTYFTYSNKIYNKLEGEVSSEKEEKKEKEGEILETEPTTITNSRDLIKIKEGYTFEINLHFQQPTKEDPKIYKTFNLKYQGIFKDGEFVLEKLEVDEVEKTGEVLKKNQEYLTNSIIADIKEVHQKKSKGKGVKLEDFFRDIGVTSFVITPPGVTKKTTTPEIGEEEAVSIVLEESPKLAAAIYKELGMQGEQGEIKIADIKNIDFSSVNPGLAKILQEKLKAKFPKIKLEFTDLPIPESTDPNIMNQEMKSSLSAFNEDPKLKRELLGPLLRAENALKSLKEKDKIAINATMNKLIAQNPLKYLELIRTTGEKGAVIRILLDPLSSDITKEIGDEIIPKSIRKKAQDFADNINNKENYLQAFNEFIAKNRERLSELEDMEEAIRKSMENISLKDYKKGLWNILVNTDIRFVHYEMPSIDVTNPLNVVNFRLENNAGVKFNFRYENGILKQIYKVEEKQIKDYEKIRGGFVGDAATMTEIQNIPITEEDQNDWIDANVLLEQLKKDPFRIREAIKIIHLDAVNLKITQLKNNLEDPTLKEDFIRDRIDETWDNMQFSHYDMLDVDFQLFLRDNLMANNIIDNNDILTAQFGVKPDALLKLSNNEEYKELEQKKKKITYILDNQEEFNNTYDSYEASFEEGNILAPVPGWFVNAHSVESTGKFFRDLNGIFDARVRTMVQIGATREYDALHDQGVTPGFQKLLDAKDINSLMPQRLSYAPALNLSDDLAILNQKEKNQIIGQANFEAMSVLIHNAHQRQDTLPHEYAHHYVRWFKDTAIVQEGIKRFGSEENLVQKIGEQATLQKGEAWNIWKKLVNWILEQLSDKQLLQVLTDSFLEAVDLNDHFTYGDPTAAQKKEAQNLYSDYRSTTKVEAGSKKDIEGFGEFVGKSKVSSSESVGFEGLGTGMTAAETESVNKMNEDGENESAGNNNSTKECN